MFQNLETQPQLIDIKRLAGMLGLSERTIYRRIAEKAVPPPIYLGRLMRWDLAVVRGWIASGCPPCDQACKEAN